MPRRVVALAWLAALALGACGSEPSAAERAASERAGQVAELVAEAKLSSEVTDVLTRAARAGDATYTVAYILSGDPGGTATITQDPPQRRVDVRVGSGAQSVIADADGAVECNLERGGWTCERSAAPSPLGSFADEQLQAVLDVIRDAGASYVFRASRREVAGVRARCLVTEPRAGVDPPAGLAGKGTMCVSDDGVVLLVETPESSLRAQQYRTKVADDAFERPDRPRG